MYKLIARDQILVVMLRQGRVIVHIVTFDVRRHSRDEGLLRLGHF